VKAALLRYDQSTLCLTRLWVPDNGFLTTIQNIMDVAKLNAYHVKIYCVWLFRRFTTGARPIGMPFGSRSYETSRSGTVALLDTQI
jgi:hypothetical protein